MQILAESNRKYNQTIIVVTHDQNIAKMCSRQIEIQDGEIV